MGVDELGKLKLRKEKHLKSGIFLRRRSTCQRGPTASAYRPRLVAHVVDGCEGVDARDASVLQPDDQVPEILVLGHAESVLADKHKVWSERPAGRNRE